MILGWVLLWFGVAMGQEVGQVCAPCHTEQVDELKTHKHFAKSVGCEICHGTSQQHRNAVGATAPDKVAAPDEVPALCGACHVAQRKDYESSKHGKIVLARSKTKAANCATCHGVHGPRNAVAMLRQCDRCHASLPASCKREAATGSAKLICATCHDGHKLSRMNPATPAR